MAPVKTSKDVDGAAKGAIEALYGKDIKDFKVRILLPYPNEHQQTAWDANCTFLLKDLQYTVDLLINQKDGQITNARLIDTMVPL